MKMKKLVFGLLGSLTLGKFYIIGGMSYFKQYEKAFDLFIQISLSDKIVLITGGTDGIGWETAKQLKEAKLVIVVGRNEGRIEQELKEFKNIKFMHLDLNDLNKVSSFTSEIKNQHIEIDILINNAGVFLTDEQQTQQGFEKNFGINYIAHYLLTMNLLGNMKNHQESRIIQVGSRAHLRAPQNLDFQKILENDLNQISNWSLYPISKLANIMFINSIAQVLKQENKAICAYSLHPGVINSNMIKGLPFYWLLSPIAWYLTKSVSQGARTTLYLAQCKNEYLKNGGYYSDMELGYQSAQALDMQKSNLLFEQTRNKLRKLGYVE